ncbi:VOC family protein [Ottowia flava]|uniref:VOC family protein n=1 Tax=Ottowia flava TaxID=2675430 RepID=A0ABW4KWL7_9BURK|nr:VOC family protein [Ottowia sp. GY511]
MSTAPSEGDGFDHAAVDHLVILADTLDQGVAWAEATLGVTPGPGGEHPMFGTHNRLLALSGPGFACCYLEIIAISPEAARADSSRAGGTKRWFDMDDAALQAQVRQSGPRLIHWVARVPGVAAASAQLAALGLDRGPVRAATRMTPAGELRWQITVRDDGQRLLDGCLPTLIEWGAAHPAATMPDSGVQLQQLALAHPQAPALEAALRAAGLAAPLKDARLRVDAAPVAELRATLRTPRGLVTLSSSSLSPSPP